MSDDARVPVLRGLPDRLRPDDALLLPPDVAAPPGHPVAWLAAVPTHRPGCACCLPRGEAARTLGRLFLARARGEVPFFTRVVAALPDAGWAEIVRAVQGDVIASARFRLVEPGPA